MEYVSIARAELPPHLYFRFPVKTLNFKLKFALCQQMDLSPVQLTDP